MVSGVCVCVCGVVWSYRTCVLFSCASGWGRGQRGCLKLLSFCDTASYVSCYCEYVSWVRWLGSDILVQFSISLFVCVVNMCIGGVVTHALLGQCITVVCVWVHHVRAVWVCAFLYLRNIPWVGSQLCPNVIVCVSAIFLCVHACCCRGSVWAELA